MHQGDNNAALPSAHVSQYTPEIPFTFIQLLRMYIYVPAAHPSHLFQMAAYVPPTILSTSIFVPCMQDITLNHSNWWQWRLSWTYR